MKFTPLGAVVVLVSCLAATSASAAFWHKAGNGHIESRPFALSDFDAVVVEGAVELDVKVGPPSLSVTVDSNLFEELTVEVQDGKLYVSTTWRMGPAARPHVIVTLPYVKAVRAAGDVLTRIETGPEAKNLELDLCGTGLTEVRGIALDTLKILADGSLEVAAFGKVGTLDLDANGTFRGSFEGLTIQKAKYHVAGKPTLMFGSVNAVSGTVFGVSSVTYLSPPAQSNSDPK